MDLLLKIDGLPAHPLIVHAAVVFTPLAALAALGYVLVPRWRAWLRVPMAVLVALALVSIVAAYLSGNNFQDSGIGGPLVARHHDWARRLLWTTVPFAALGFATAWWHTRGGVVRVALHALLGVGAVAVLVLVVITGDAGARAVWAGQ